jgi:hypothetical protein
MTLPALFPASIADTVRWPADLPLAAFEPRVTVLADLTEVLDQCGECPELDGPLPALWLISYRRSADGPVYRTPVCGSLCADQHLDELLAVGAHTYRRPALDIALHLPTEWATSNQKDI